MRPTIAVTPLLRVKPYENPVVLTDTRPGPAVKATVRWRFAYGIAAALAIYFVWGALLIAQRPGLQEDEAMLAEAAVAIGNPATALVPLEFDHRWLCVSHHCLPLMSADYVGAIKAYLVLPFFALRGPSVLSVRVVSLLLGAIGIWGLGYLVSKHFGKVAGVATALVLAFSPTYLTMVVFDNNAIGALMAAYGLTAAALARYLRRSDVMSAALLGLAIGFGIWARANFLWTVIAGAIVIALVAGRRAMIPVRHVLAMMGGAAIGGLPFLIFQVLSKGITWTDQNVFAAHSPLAELLRNRIFYFSEMLFMEGEHREMWSAAGSLPHWQLTLFPALVVASACVCLVPSIKRQDHRSRLGFGVSFFLLAAILFSSRMLLVEHHIIALLPFAVIVVVLACQDLARRHRVGVMIAAAVSVLYFPLAFHADFLAVSGLHRSGGMRDWSDAAETLAAKLDRERADRSMDNLSASNLPLKVLDWGFENTVYVMTNGRVIGEELYWGATAEKSGRGHTWDEEVRKGGRFLMPGPDHTHLSAGIAGFERAMAEVKPDIAQWVVRQRNGEVFATVIEVQPSVPAALISRR